MCHCEHAISIYRLRDPRDGSIFYVGATDMNLHARLLGHIAAANSKTRPAKSGAPLRTGQILDAGFRPQIELITEAQSRFANAVEKHFIGKYRAEGHELTNRANGGYMTEHPWYRGETCTADPCDDIFAAPYHWREVDGQSVMTWPGHPAYDWPGFYENGFPWWRYASQPSPAAEQTTDYRPEA